MNFQYNPAVPQAQMAPSQSQPIMLGNFQYLCGSAGKGLLRDHNMLLNNVPAGDGIHLQTTFLNRTVSPGFAGGNGVLYTQEITPPAGPAAAQLFFDASSPSAPVQLTSHTPVKGTSGFTYLPGGLILIWGKNTAANGTVISFPNDPATSSPLMLSAAAYAVVISENDGANFDFIKATLIGPTGFTVVIIRSAGGGQTTPVIFNWIAIGPA